MLSNSCGGLPGCPQLDRFSHVKTSDLHLFHSTHISMNLPSKGFNVKCEVKIAAAEYL